jgi:hypothetical protein
MGNKEFYELIMEYTVLSYINENLNKCREKLELIQSEKYTDLYYKLSGLIQAITSPLVDKMDKIETILESK